MRIVGGGHLKYNIRLFFFIFFKRKKPYQTKNAMVDQEQPYISNPHTQTETQSFLTLFSCLPSLLFRRVSHTPPPPPPTISYPVNSLLTFLNQHYPLLCEFMASYVSICPFFLQNCYFLEIQKWNVQLWILLSLPLLFYALYFPRKICGLLFRLYINFCR